MISIVMPVYNRELLVHKAIKSVLDQTEKNWELIVVDDCSTDNTYNELLKYDDSRIKKIKLEKNSGANYARNIGMDNAEGEYLAFLDSDNCWANDYLEKRIHDIVDSNADVVFGRWYLESDTKKNIYPLKSAEDLTDQSLLTKYMFYENALDTNVVLMKRVVYQNEGGFDVEFKRFQDWEFFLRLLLTEKYRFSFSDDILVTLYSHNDSISARNEYCGNRMKLFRKYEQNISCEEQINVLKHIFKAVLTNGGGQEEHFLELLSNEEKNLLCKNTIYREIVDDQKSYISYLEEQLYSYSQIIDNLNNDIGNLQGVIGWWVERSEFYKKWIMFLREKGSCSKAFKKYDVQNVAVYGYGENGKMLLDKLEKEQNKSIAVIDKAFADSKQPNFYAPEHKLDDIDAIIVSCIDHYDEVVETLTGYDYNIPIISLTDFVCV